MEKLPVLDLEYVFDLLWDIKDTDQLKNAWNGCHCLNINTRDSHFLELIEKYNLQPYLDEADSEADSKRVPVKHLIDCMINQNVYIEKAKRYDEIVAWLDAPESTSVILDMIKEVTEEPF